MSSLTTSSAKTSANPLVFLCDFLQTFPGSWVTLQSEPGNKKPSLVSPLQELAIIPPMAGFFSPKNPPFSGGFLGLR